jgi:hypothetical protein
MSPQRPRRVRAALAGALAITALAAPVAGARLPTENLPDPSGNIPSAPVVSQAPAPTVTRTAVVDDGGFDWGSAALGAGSAGVLLVLAAAGASTMQHHHRRARMAP